MTLSRRTLMSGASATTAALVAGPRHGRAQSMPVFRIAVLTDLSGQYRDNSGPTSVIAARQAVEDFNPKQHGFDVEILSADHQQKPDIGSALARQWFDRDGVDAISDLNNTAVAIAVNTIVTQHDKVQLTTGAASSDLTGKYCNPNMVHFTPDSYADPRSTGGSILKAGGDTWYLIVSDYVFGHSIEREISALIKERGGKILGTSAYPFPGTTDYSSFLVAAQSSGAKVLGLCNSGGDMENCVKQAREFGLAERGMTVAALIGFATEVKSMGLETAQGLLVSEPFYWDLNDRTRAFTQRFLPKSPANYPTSLHACNYSATTHYMKAIAKLGPDAAKASGRAAIAAMKAMPTDDDCFGANRIREDGRFLAPIHLFQVKKPSESRMPWDVYNLKATTPADEAWRPMQGSGCTMVKT